MNRDAIALEVIKVMLAEENTALQHGSGNGGVERQSEWIAWAAYKMADAMIEQSQGRGLQTKK